MAVIHLNNFGGEIPRVPARNLPEGAAQDNINLLATNQEFRPVLGHSVVYGVWGVPQDTKTLYRTQADFSTGQMWSDLTQGWVYTDKAVNIVRGQVVDDTTERHFYTQDDGSMPPRTNNNKGEDYALGIPRPPKPEVSQLTASRLTRAQATEWKKVHLIPGVFEAVSACLSVDPVTSRFSVTAYDAKGGRAGFSRAGITSLINPGPADQFEYFPVTSATDTTSQRGQFEPWNMMMAVPNYLSVPEGIGNPQLGGIVSGAFTWLGLPVLPLWGVLDVVSLRNRFIGFTNPAGDPLWRLNQIDYLVESMTALLSADFYVEVTTRRSSLDKAYLEYIKAGETLLQNTSRPVIQAGESQSDFDTRMAAWTSLQSSGVSAMVTASAKMGRITQEIEAVYSKLSDNLLSVLTDWLSNVRLEKTDNDIDGLVVIDEDQVIDTRFYVTTYVTGWGEESSPSEPSDMLEVGANDLVVINQPSKTDVATDRNITKWRLYRSNAGSTTSAFQLVDEQSYTDTVQAPYVGWGRVGVAIAGFGDKDKWRDIIANWVVYINDRGESASSSPDAFRDNSKLRVGDTVTQHNSNSNTVNPSDATYLCTKTWNGSAWVLNTVPSVSGQVGKARYVDGKYGADLGEVCPTTTWLPPPYRSEDTSVRIPVAKGNNPYLRGLTAMANGVMLGFVDNYLAPCDPYHGYAYPVEYQIPLKFPIVGICSMGQSAIVGTKGIPYIVSGADSASLSVQLLNLSQPCLSARSMVAAMGGVFYASPDGYCFADNTGVTVATDGLFAREDWQKLDPSSIFAVVHDQVLYFWFTGNGGGCYGMDMVAKKLTKHSIQATAAFEDAVTDSVYVTFGGEIRQLFSGVRKQGQWKSSKITLPSQRPLAWIRVLADFDNSPVVVNWYGDGVLRHTATFNSIDPQRLPTGRYLEHEVEVISTNRVTSVTLASTTAEFQES